MRRILVSLFVGVVSAGICFAQSTQSQTSASASQDTSVSAGQSGASAHSNTSGTAAQATSVSDKQDRTQAVSTSQLQTGSTVQAELTRSLDARKSKVGDEVVAK